MFNGIINQLAQISTVELIDEHNQVIAVKLTKELKIPAELGDSIAINGVCLTVDKIISGQEIKFSLGKITLDTSSLANIKLGDFINLETALQLKSLISGHLLSGHIDAVGEIESIQEKGGSGKSHHFVVSYPKKLAQFIAKKGSIAVDGVSLTINEINDNFSEQRASFEINIIPFTYNQTLFSYYNIKTLVNLEVDLLARYISRQINH